MDVMEAIYNRRSVRAYTDQPVDRMLVEALIKAATHAPSSMNEQPWGFVIIQDPKRLTSWSDRIRTDLLKRIKPDSPFDKYRDMIANPEYHVFHRAGTLIIICARAEAHNGAEDCSLAAQNLMLAGYAVGLGSCPIGFARPWSRQSRIKRSVSIPDAYIPVFPVVLGYPKGDTPVVPRRTPDILLWE